MEHAGSRRVRAHPRATSSSRATGRYELRVTNELEETLFVDRLQLIAVDHPADVEVYPNEGLKARPAGVRAARRRAAPRPVARAIDDAARRDRSRWPRSIDSYPDGFALDAIRGYAEPHALTLDLGADAEPAPCCC